MDMHVQVCLLLWGKSSITFPFHPGIVATLWVRFFLSFHTLEFTDPSTSRLVRWHKTGIKQPRQRRAGTHETHGIPMETQSVLYLIQGESPLHRKEPPTF